MTDQPWHHPETAEEWDEDLPPVVILSPDYAGDLPLYSEEGGLAWERTKFSPALLDRLAAWPLVTGVTGTVVGVPAGAAGHVG
jgi:hypothetical protein